MPPISLHLSPPRTPPPSAPLSPAAMRIPLLLASLCLALLGLPARALFTDFFCSAAKQSWVVCEGVRDVNCPCGQARFKRVDYGNRCCDPSTVTTLSTCR